MAVQFPAIPDATVREGARWRHHKPSSDQVAEWFATVPLDDEMQHEQYVGGVVLISQTEKVKYAQQQGTAERHELVFTPYVQIGTRVAYFRHLAERRGLIPVSQPVQVPRTSRPESPYFNGNMPDGLWWHVVQADRGISRFLCSTWRVALYERATYAASKRGDEALPLLEGIGTKQVSGFPDINQIAKAQTGSLGRALGVAGILVVGTGIASAEDMQEFVGTEGTPQQLAALPPSEIAPGEAPEPVDPGEQAEALRSRALALQATMQESAPQDWQTFVAWWNERKTEERWTTLDAVPLEGLKAIVSFMERLAAQRANEPTQGEA